MTIRPVPARSSGRKPWTICTWPITLMSSCLRICSMGTHSSGAVTAMPALLTSPHSPAPPSSPVTSSTAARTDFSSVTSTITGVSRPAAAARSRSPSSGRRTPARVWKPTRDMWSAQASPRPEEAPVISTARPAGDVGPDDFDTCSLRLMAWRRAGSCSAGRTAGRSAPLPSWHRWHGRRLRLLGADGVRRQCAAHRFRGRDFSMCVGPCRTHSYGWPGWAEGVEGGWALLCGMSLAQGCLCTSPFLPKEDT